MKNPLENPSENPIKDPLKKKHEKIPRPFGPRCLPALTKASVSVPLTLISTISYTFLSLTLLHISSCFCILSIVNDRSHLEHLTVCNETLASLSEIICSLVMIAGESERKSKTVLGGVSSKLP